MVSCMQDVNAKLSKLKLQAKAKIAKEAKEAKEGKGGKSGTPQKDTKDGAGEKEKVRHIYMYFFGLSIYLVASVHR